MNRQFQEDCKWFNTGVISYVGKVGSSGWEYSWRFVNAEVIIRVKQTVNRQEMVFKSLVVDLIGRRSHDVIGRLTFTVHLTLMMTSNQIVETSVNVITNSPYQDYTHPDDHTTPTYEPQWEKSDDLRTLLSPKLCAFRLRQVLRSRFPELWPSSRTFLSNSSNLKGSKIEW